jgi:hypothetical protein
MREGTWRGVTIVADALCAVERDSRKDETVVFIFIFATGGLLAWAACKPWIERYVEVGPEVHDTEISRLIIWQAARERRSYIPVAEPDH